MNKPLGVVALRWGGISGPWGCGPWGVRSLGRGVVLSGGVGTPRLPLQWSVRPLVECILVENLNHSVGGSKKGPTD